MIPTSADGYERYYANKLWMLIPAVYRAEDSDVFDKPGPLRELVDRIGVQAAVLRRSIDRLWEDQSIESCDDWIIPYIADLLATNLVPGLDARGQRLDVAKTIYYRRRKGTVAILEEIAGDVTGWEARVVEFFRRLGRGRHGLDPAIGLPAEPVFPDRLQKAQGLIGAHTHTAAGGYADLRNRYGASRAHTAFDEFAHTADMRRGKGRFGWHNIPRLGVFLWRLKSFGVDQTTPVPIAGCTDWYTFDPTGRDVRLFAAASRKEARRFGETWITPDEWQLPGRIDDGLWSAYQDELYPPSADAARSLGIFTRSIAGYNLVALADTDLYPERGRFRVHNPPVTTAVFGTYHYGFSSTIGAGPYDRRTRASKITAPVPALSVSGGGACNALATGTTTIEDSLTYASAAAVTPISNAFVNALNEKRPVIRLATGAVWEFEGAPGAELTLDGIFVSGGDVVLTGEFETVTLRCVTLDPGTQGEPPNVFLEAADGRDLAPVTLWIEGKVRSITATRCILGQVRTRNGGILGEFSATDSILQAIRTGDNGPFTPADVKDSLSLAEKLRDAPTPLTQHLAATFPPVLANALAAFTGNQPPPAQLISDIVDEINLILGGPALFTDPLFEGIILSPATLALKATNPLGPDLATLNRLLLEEAFPMELGDAAVAMADGDTRLSRVTVLGRLHVHRLEASECILDDFAVTEDPQRGCVRFSAWVTGSVLPRKYESLRIQPGGPVFTSRMFGQPGYAQLLESADSAVLAPNDASILEGSQDGSEMGAFASEKNPQKQRGLLIKFEEFMPLGLAPVLVSVY